MPKAKVPIQRSSRSYPVGIPKAQILGALKKAPKLPSVSKVMPRMKRLPKMDAALAEGRLIWTYPDLADLRGYFQSLVSS